MSRINMFGVSGSGKTCFLYAMAQVLRKGVHAGEDCVSMIATRLAQQQKLDDGFLELIEKRWPQGTDMTQEYVFAVNMSCDGEAEYLPSFEFLDYKGGILTGGVSEEKMKDFLESFRGSSAIIFIVDGQTLIEAMPPEKRDAVHRDIVGVKDNFLACKQVQRIENLFMEFKSVEQDIPPVLVAISKGDLFASDEELENAIDFVMRSLPTLFGSGAEVTAGVTVMSLGENLGNDGGMISGLLSLTTDFNIHIPVVFGIYCDLDYEYNATEDLVKKERLERLCAFLRKILDGRIRLYINGKKAYAID